MTSVQEFNCIFCKESFDNKEDLQIHFRKHGDPNFNNSKKTKSRILSEPQVSSNDKRNEDNEMVNCDVCSEVFPTISKAITHKHKLHPDHDAKYFCPRCGKLFTMKHLFNKHTQSAHENMEKNDDINYHCDVCNVDFFVASAMLYHNKFFHRQDTDLPSIGQSKKFKNVAQEVLPIYYCAFCGEEYDNKVNLHKHMVDDHGDENQSPEDVLRCPLCEAIFYHLDAYELHLTFHSIDDLYSERNEIFEQIDEFSLETVPPTMEKVENAEPQDVESAMNAIGLATFLEMAMDNEHPKKSKKHKKHKKSKKAAITLDEFLSMNTDVFGEGIDFQGVEEIPTQVVKKKLKQKKANKKTGALTVIEGSDLEKLKKQGIVVKKKPSQLAPMQNIKIGSKILQSSTQIPKQATSNKSNIQTPDDVLSKLINQSNSQIKIVKKTNQNAVGPNPEVKLPDTEVSTAKTVATAEKIEIECDIMQSGYTSSETETKDEGEELMKETRENDVNISAFEHESRSKETSSSETINTYDNQNLQKQDIKPDIRPSKHSDSMKKTKNNMHVANKQLQASPNNIVSNNSNKSDEPVKAMSAGDSDKATIEKRESNKKSLDALKHLSHLITVKSVNSNICHLTQKDTDKTDIPDEKQPYSDPSKIENESRTQESIVQSDEIPLRTLEGLKSLSKSITIKSLAHSPKNFEDKFVTDMKTDSDEESKREKLTNSARQSSPNQNSPSKALVIRNVDTNDQSPKHLSKVQQSNKNVCQTNVCDKLNESTNKNTNLLKHLTNITAKTVSTVKINQTKINDQCDYKQNIPVKNTPQKEINKQINEDMEIFNIDDSESEEDKIDSTLPQPKESKVVTSKNTSIVSFNKLNTLNKTITVKPVNIQSTQVNTNFIKQELILEKSGRQSPNSEFSDEGTFPPNDLKINSNNENMQKSTIHNTLKNLSKHITVKPSSSSPSTQLKCSKDKYPQDFGDAYHGNSDNESMSGKVKISEFYDEDFSDDEMRDEFMKDNQDYDRTCNIGSPGDPMTYNDKANTGTDDELSDFESPLPTSTITKPIKKIDGFQSNNKGVTLKTMNIRNSNIESKPTKSLPSFPTGLSIKTVKQIKTEPDKNLVSNKNMVLAKPDRLIQNQLVSHAAENSQLNTVNKEVTVKTFQTKTVIEEITTTVTKTIKTVNQTVKQRLQSTSQSTLQSGPLVKCQTSATNPHLTKFQGITVRHATPPAGTKVRGMPPMNASSGPTVRTQRPARPNQLASIRPNSYRATAPRMPAMKKAITPSSNNQHNVAVGKQIKVSTSGPVTVKRPTEDNVSHFSCFKKPKESLIPVSDIPSFDNTNDDESSVHYTSSSSKSNFSSSTKTVRGGGTVVTATQIQSEMSSSSQNLSKLNSLSGITIVKTSQSKQAMQVVEKSEVNPSKRNTLEAIEKLQKQGLLVKKPRLDQSNYSDPSDDDQYLSEEPEQ